MKGEAAAAQSRVGAGWGRITPRKQQLSGTGGGFKNQYEYCEKGKFRVDISEFRTLNMQTPLIAFRRNRTHDVFDAIARFSEGNNLMSFVRVYPEELSAAADQLQSITAAFSAGNAAAAGPTTAVVPAAADEVSALTAARFAVHGERYQTLSAQAVAIHQLLAATLAVAAGSYAATEAASAAASAL